jgi:hypothetical protein
MSERISCCPGQKPIILWLQRKLFPQYGFVTHKSHGFWHADLIQSAQRWTGASRKELFDKFTTELLNRDYLAKQKNGRPKKRMVKTTLALSPFVRAYVDRLTTTLEVDRSTAVSNLATKAHAGMDLADQDNHFSDKVDCSQASDDHASQTQDDQQLIDSLREKALGPIQGSKTKRQIMDEIASNTRLDIEKESKGFIAKLRTDKLVAEEARAERRVKRED